MISVEVDEIGQAFFFQICQADLNHPFPILLIHRIAEIFVGILECSEGQSLALHYN